MTIGITPTRPETQYGYIERGEGDGPVYDVTRFREKPDLETAETFLQSGRFFWNGGIFMFRAGEMAAELARQQPEVWAQAKRPSSAPSSRANATGLIPKPSPPAPRSRSITR
jgi:mannose-1-phosphate guanylyltransferase